MSDLAAQTPPPPRPYFHLFYTPPHNSDEAILFHVGRPYVRPSVSRTTVRPPVFRFLDDNISKHQWIFTKLGLSIDVVEIWFEIANGKLSLDFDGVICPRHAHILFPDDNLSKCQRILTKLGTCINIKAIGLLIANGQISSIFQTELSARDTIMAGYCRLTFPLLYIQWSINCVHCMCVRCSRVFVKSGCSIYCFPHSLNSDMSRYGYLEVFQ